MVIRARSEACYIEATATVPGVFIVDIEEFSLGEGSIEMEKGWNTRMMWS